jgi:hypothetical protein
MKLAAGLRFWAGINNLIQFSEEEINRSSFLIFAIEATNTIYLIRTSFYYVLRPMVSRSFLQVNRIEKNESTHLKMLEV